MKFLITFAIFLQMAFVFGMQGYPPQYEYYVPRPSFTAINPVGYRMSIPHRPGIEDVVFHVRVQQHFNKDGGNNELTFPATRWNARWTFTDTSTQVNSGDEVYFWISVKKDGKEFKYDNGKILVTEHAFSSEESVSSSEERRAGYGRW